MAKKIARYSVSYGLRGCYMPNYTSGPIIATTRRELADAIREEIRMLDLPRARFKQVKIRNLWSFIARNGSSVAHFSIDGEPGHELAFHGLTEEEAETLERQDNE